MKLTLPSIVTTILLFGNLASMQSQDDYIETIKEYRDSVNQVFADPEQTILTNEDVDHFEGLHFFPADEDYKVKVKFKKIKNGEPFEMQTTTDRLPVYLPYGKIKFKVKGEKCCLTVYQNVELVQREEYKDYLFLPFTDVTSGEESYGGGRYLDVKIGDLTQVREVDFNLCYNPYCAYNSRYSCPIPPLENHLDVKIEAGVKKWHD